MNEEHDDILCNLCGSSCVLRPPNPTEFSIVEPGGLIKAVVHGGYESTPGNGYGALDDTTSYTFSICEFCLDWLFARFKIPVTIGDDPPATTAPNDKIWEPAAERIRRDEWRKMKSVFEEESKKRNALRSLRYANVWCG